MIHLVTTPYYIIERYPGRSVIRVGRTPLAYENAEAIDRDFALIHAAMDAIDRPRFGLLVDLRDGPLRTDPAFDNSMAQHRKKLLSGFARVAVLVKSALGRLQVQRHNRVDATPAEVFDDETAALAHAMGRPSIPR